MDKGTPIRLCRLIKLTKRLVGGDGWIFLSLILGTGGLMEKLLEGEWLFVLKFHWMNGMENFFWMIMAPFRRNLWLFIRTCVLFESLQTLLGAVEINYSTDLIVCYFEWNLSFIWLLCWPPLVKTTPSQPWVHWELMERILFPFFYYKRPSWSISDLLHAGRIIIKKETSSILNLMQLRPTGRLWQHGQIG